jgi:hypothetical protein
LTAECVESTADADDDDAFISGPCHTAGSKMAPLELPVGSAAIE